MPESYGLNGTTLHLEHLVLKAQNAASWTNSYVLAAGELGIELDTKKYKLGDGTTTWQNLEYYTNPVTDSLVSGLTTRVTTVEGTLTSLGTRMDTAEGNIQTNASGISSNASDIAAHGTRLDAAEGDIASQGTRISALEGITTVSANSFSSPNS